MVFDEDSMLRDKSETEDKAQGGASDSSTADIQEKRVEFLESPKKPDDEDSSDSDGDDHGTTQEQPRPLRRSVSVTVPPTRYDGEYHVSFALVTETGDPSSYREAIETDDHDKWTAMEHEMKFRVEIKHESRSPKEI